VEFVAVDHRAVYVEEDSLAGGEKLAGVLFSRDPSGRRSVSQSKSCLHGSTLTTLSLPLGSNVMRLTFRLSLAVDTVLAQCLAQIGFGNLAALARAMIDAAVIDQRQGLPWKICHRAVARDAVRQDNVQKGYHRRRRHGAN
jgi:hypothetical protein